MKIYNISTISIVNKNLSSIIKLGKNITNTMDGTNVVYKFCYEKCEACYIDETKRSLKTRIKEYKYKTSKDIKNKNNESIVSQHQINFNHEFDWNNVLIVDSESDYKKRLISEMIHIKCHQNNINKKEDIHTLNHNYFPLLKNLKI